MALRDMIVLVLLFGITSIGISYITDRNTFNMYDARYGTGAPTQLGLWSQLRGDSTAQASTAYRPATSAPTISDYRRTTTPDGKPSYTLTPYEAGAFRPERNAEGGYTYAPISGFSETQGGSYSQPTYAPATFGGGAAGSYTMPPAYAPPSSGYGQGFPSFAPPMGGYPQAGGW